MKCYLVRASPRKTNDVLGFGNDLVRSGNMKANDRHEKASGTILDKEEALRDTNMLAIVEYVMHFLHIALLFPSTTGSPLLRSLFRSRTPALRILDV